MENQGDLYKKNQQAFLGYIAEIQEKRLSQVAVRKATKKYDFRNSKIHNVTPLRAKKIYNTLLSKYVTGVSNGKNWLQNQRRLFIWCIVCYLYKSGKQIHELNDEEFNFFKNIFIGKDRNLLKFQTFSLIKRNNKNVGWKIQQDEILIKILEKNSDQVKDWGDISKQFFQDSNQLYFRNSKQCRQRWLNHLDPNKIKGKWLPEQDKLLLQGVLEKGKKWSQIVSLLDSKKNEHMIKNRYKSLVHKKQKQLNFINIKENELIHMIVEELQKGINPQKEKKSEKIFSNQEFEVEKYIDDSPDEKVEQNLKQTVKRVLRTRRKKKEKSQKNQHKQQANIQIQSMLPKMTNRLIVQPKNQNQIKNKQKIITNEILKQKRQIDFENDRNQMQENDQFQDNNKKEDNEFYEKLFQSANTLIGDSRFPPPIILDARSPANFLVSPYPPNAWTPTIFLYDDSQRQVSPQLSYTNSFGSKISSNFHKFVPGGDKKQ